MKFVSAFIVLFFISFVSFGQDTNALIKEADRLEGLPNEKAALLKFKEVLKQQPSHLYALTKCSELCARIGGREKTNLKLRDDYYAAAVIYANTALRLYPENDVANVTMAIAVGKTILLKSGREKINAVKDLKNYADKALAENPNNFKAWHVLGRWNYEVSNLNFLERAGASIIYGGLPSASLKTSIECYEKAKALNPAFAFNSLELAKAYHRDGQDDKARQQLQAVLALRNMTEDDPRIKDLAQGFLNKWEL